MLDGPEKCPFCEGTYRYISKPMPLVSHTQPRCQKFDESDIISFLAAVEETKRKKVK
jgi:hypothetical protein